MSDKIGGNAWCDMIHHRGDGILEMRWLPTAMTDSAFKASLALLAVEAERLRPAFMLIDVTQFRHRPGEGVMQWRNDSIVPRYGAAGVRKMAFHAPAEFPGTIEKGGSEAVDGPAIFPTAWFSKRENALEWFRKN